MIVEPVACEAFWAKLRASTPARIGLSRSGVSIATADHLAFQLAHAQARDAVHETFDAPLIARQLRDLGEQVLELHTKATDRAQYLLRPDLGRALDEPSRLRLQDASLQASDICLVVADGLSPRAIQTNALPFLRTALPKFRKEGWKTGPISLVDQGRGAVADEIGQAFQAKLVAILVGERPGLSAADSMGIYLTWQPRVGRSDAERNCLSNIRPGGMPIEEAAVRLQYLCNQAFARKLTGVHLKDETTFVEGVKTPASAETHRALGKSGALR